MTLAALNQVFTKEFPGFTGFTADPLTIDVTGSMNGRTVRIMGYDHWCNLGEKLMFKEIRRQLTEATESLNCTGTTG